MRGNGVGTGMPAASSNMRFINPSLTSRTSSTVAKDISRSSCRELELPVGTGVLIAETAGNLEVTVDAAHHQNLLELLRRLRQRVEVAGVESAWAEHVPRAFGRAVHQDRGFDFKEPLFIHVLPGGENGFVSNRQHLLHLGRRRSM